MKTLIDNLCGLLSSILVGSTVVLLLHLGIKFVFAVILGILTFLIYKYLTTEIHETIVFEFNFPHMKPFLLRKDLLLVLAYVSSLVAVVFFTPINDVEFIAWGEIPFINFVRLISAIFLTTFFPGYAILRLLDREHRITGVGAIVFSMVLSFFFTSLSGFFLILIGQSLNQIGVLALTAFNGLLLTTLLIASPNIRNEAVFQQTLRYNKHRIYNSLILDCLVLLELSFVYSLCSINFPLPPYDEWFRHGTGVCFSEGFFPSNPYPWFLHMHLGFVYALSGFPTINVHQVLISLSLTPILAFYVTVKAFFGNNSRIPAIATAFGFFGGFGWLYVLYLKACGATDLFSIFWLSSQKTFSLNFTPVFYLAPYFAPAHVVGVTSFLLLLYLMYSLGLSEGLRHILTVIVGAYGFLGHIIDIPIFVLFLLFTFFFSEHNLISRFKMLACLLLSLLIAAAIDLLAPEKVYIGTHFYVSFFLTLVAFCFALIGEKTNFKLLILRATHRLIGKLKFEGSPKAKETLKAGFVVSLVYLYGLCFIIWDNLVPRFNALETFFQAQTALGVFNTNFIPWYMYPMIVGTLGLLGLATVIFLIYARNWKHLKVFNALVFFALLCGRALRFFPFHWEIRLVTWLWIPLCVFAAFIIIHFFRHISSLKSIAKHVTASLLLGLIIISGITSSLYYVEFLSLGYAARGYQLSEGELEALNYLRVNCPPYASVLTVTQVSQYALIGYAGRAGMAQTPALHSNDPEVSQWFTPRRPETVIYQLDNASVRYLYLASRDIDVLRSNRAYREGFICRHLLQYLPIVFKNSEVTIYEFPPFSSPTDSKVGVTMPYSMQEMFLEFNPLTSSFFGLEMIALSQIRYSLYLDIDNNYLNSSIIILTYDPSEGSAKYLQRTEAGGRLVVLNSLGYGEIANLLSISSNKTVISDGVHGEGGSIAIPPIHVSKMFSENNETIPIAYYTKDGTPVSPFAFLHKLGDGEIIYVEVLPIFSALQSMMDNNMRRSLFASLGALIKVLALPFETETPAITRYTGLDFLYGQIDMTGKVQLESNTITLPNTENLPISILNLSSVKKCIIDDEESNVTLVSNALIQDLRIYGPTKVCIYTSMVKIPSIGCGGYASFLFEENLNLTLDMSDEAKITFRLIKNSSSLNASIQGGVARLVILTTQLQEPCMFLLKGPILFVQGETYLEKNLIHIRPYKPLSDLFPVLIYGNTTFKIEYSEKITFISGFTFDGTVKILDPRYVLRWNEWDIPWPQVLHSNLHFLLLSGIALIALIQICRAKHVRVYIYRRKII